MSLKGAFKEKRNYKNLFFNPFFIFLFFFYPLLGFCGLGEGLVILDCKCEFSTAICVDYQLERSAVEDVFGTMINLMTQLIKN